MVLEMSTAIIFAVSCFFIVFSAAADECTTKFNNTDARLRNDIFCKYDKYVRPREDSTSLINVTLRLDLKHIDVHEFDNALTVHTWIVIDWEDIFTRWKPSNYDNITHIVIPTNVVWVPDLVIYNTDSSSKLLFQKTLCVLYHTGQIVCTPEVSAPLYCKMKLENWPYDSQNCTMIIGSWTWGYHLNIIKDSVEMGAFVENKHWKLVKVSVLQPIASYIEYDFIIQRHSAPHVASVIVPAFVVSALTLSSFWVRHGVTRMAMCCVACIADALFLQYVGFVVPSSGDTTPSIVKFYRDAMVLCMVSLILSLLVHSASQSQHEAPHWVSRYAMWLRGNSVISLLLVEHETSQVLQGDSPSVLPPRAQDSVRPPWHVFAQLFDRLSFFALLIVHLLLLLALLP